MDELRLRLRRQRPARDADRLPEVRGRGDEHRPASDVARRGEAMKLSDLLDRPMYYDRAGNAIDMGRWLDLHQDFGYCTVAETIVGGVWRVHTAWMGIDHQYLWGPPLIFETMTFELAESHGFIGPSAWTGDG
jgi:hypothetical protein